VRSKFYIYSRHADSLYVELQEEVEARAEAIRALLPVLYSSLQEGRDGRRAQSYLLGRVRAAVCELVQLFERNQLRGGSRTGEFLNSMDAVLEGDNNDGSNHLQWAALADTAKSLVRQALAVAAAAASKHHDDNRDISVICRNIVERLQQAGLEEEEVEGGSRQELLHLLELLEERVNSALLRQVTDHLSCVDQPLDSLVHRLS
jgi:hypothetical protein